MQEQENKQSKYILLEEKPAEIPATHRYREIDPETFAELMEFVTHPVDHEGFVLVKSPVSQYVISNIRCKRGAKVAYIPIAGAEHDIELGPSDFAIVIAQARIGFFMGFPSIRGRKRVLERCVFGIMTPLPNNLHKPV